MHYKNLFLVWIPFAVNAIQKRKWPCYSEIQGLLLLKNNFSKNHQFLYWSPQSPLRVPCKFPCRFYVRSFRRRPCLAVCWLGVSYDNLLGCNVYHSKIVADHSSFIHLRYSRTDLITQHLNPLFYDLWSIYHPRALSRNSDKKVVLLVFFKKCKF